MKCKMIFKNPKQTFEFNGIKNHQELLDSFLALNKGFYFKEIKLYGKVTKCSVYNCLDEFVDIIEITSSK